MSVCSSPFCPLRPDSPCARRYGLSLRNTFVLSVLSSIATGLMFDIPMVVQPMKSITAVALTAEAGEFSIALAPLLDLLALDTPEAVHVLVLNSAVGRSMFAECPAAAGVEFNTAPQWWAALVTNDLRIGQHGSPGRV